MVLDKELNKQIASRKRAVAEVDSLKKQNAEILAVAQAAAQGEEKKNAMLQEVKILVAKEREKLS